MGTLALASSCSPTTSNTAAVRAPTPVVQPSNKFIALATPTPTPVKKLEVEEVDCSAVDLAGNWESAANTAAKRSVTTITFSNDRYRGVQTQTTSDSKDKAIKTRYTLVLDTETCVATYRMRLKEQTSISNPNNTVTLKLSDNYKEPKEFRIIQYHDTDKNKDVAFAPCKNDACSELDLTKAFQLIRSVNVIYN